MDEMIDHTSEVSSDTPGGADPRLLVTVRERLRSPHWIASAIVFFLALFLLLTKGGMGGVLFLLPFTFGPMIVSLLLGLAVPSRRGQLMLLIANLLYFGGFLWMFLNAFLLHPDPQAGIAFVFIGFYSLPVMIPLWIFSFRQPREKAVANPATIGGML